ncbi:hypothetical protein [Paractinoplanes toevensis]|uniref:Uncharacterized protein n=1 Tax=Paractinoplanes toevensis TaxID=571911 RepID=A0A920BRA6_9ACTN|nr:hypothetical protein [Actinoplanes toevensis]GIM97963.1 hypothetical protein Ato02nite_097560 [Actinoplanes toevensis]
MERRVPGQRLEIAGAVLTVSTMGGYSVTHRSEYLGYLHASVGDQFNVYRRKVTEMDDYLGKYRLDDGVKAILRACSRTIGGGERDAA